MQINREEVYTIQLCEHSLVKLRTIIHEFLFNHIDSNDDFVSEELIDLTDFAQSFMNSTDEFF